MTVVKKMWARLQCVVVPLKHAFGYLPRKFRGPPSEDPKTVVYRGRRRLWKPFLIHFTPLAASSVITAMNLKGFYIGSSLPGQTDATSQSFYLLLLQITAKLLVSVLLKPRGRPVNMRHRLIEWKGASSCRVFRSRCSRGASLLLTSRSQRLAVRTRRGKFQIH